MHMFKKKMLFISPCFFDYYKDLISEFNNIGIDVTWFNDRPSENFVSKALIRINKKLSFIKNNRYFKSIRKTCQNNKFDYVLVIFGQFFCKRYIFELRKMQPTAKFIYYTWDSAENYSVIKEISDLFDQKFSFDPVDCEKYGFTFLPLFYCNHNYKEGENKYLASAIFTVKPGKLHRYSQIKKMFSPGTIYEYLYLQSKIVYLFYKVRYKKEFSNYKMKDFKFKKLGRNQTYNIFSQSKIIIDVQMENQIGLTMRTFEALHCRKKLITSNSSIKKYDFYNEDDIVVIDEDNSTIPTTFFDKEFVHCDCVANYSINCFVNKLIGNGDIFDESCDNK